MEYPLVNVYSSLWRITILKMGRSTNYIRAMASSSQTVKDCKRFTRGYQRLPPMFRHGHVHVFIPLMESLFRQVVKTPIRQPIVFELWDGSRKVSKTICHAHEPCRKLKKTSFTFNIILCTICFLHIHNSLTYIKYYTKYY